MSRSVCAARVAARIERFLKRHGRDAREALGRMFKDDGEDGSGGGAGWAYDGGTGHYYGDIDASGGGSASGGGASARSRALRQALGLASDGDGGGGAGGGGGNDPVDGAAEEGGAAPEEEEEDDTEVCSCSSLASLGPTLSVCMQEAAFDPDYTYAERIIGSTVPLGEDHFEPHLQVSLPTPSFYVKSQHASMLRRHCFLGCDAR